MVKQISVVCFCILALALSVAPAVAEISYCKDFLEPGNQDGSLKTFDEEWTLAQNETVVMNIWINDVPESQLLTAGFFITYDPAMVTVVSVEAYETPEGPWDGGLTNLVPDAGGPGNYFVAVGNLSCTNTDSDGDIIVGKVRLESKSPGNTDIIISTPPGFDTVVGCEGSGTIYDLQITPNTITINNGNGTSSTTTGPGTSTSTSPSTTTTGPGTSTSTSSAGSSTTTTETSSSSWQSAYAMMWGEDKEQKLSLLRFFRDAAVARNQVVRNYVSLLYQHTAEVAGVFIKHPLLCLETSELVEALLPSIESFFETEKLILTAGQQDRVESFLNQFESKVSPELKGIIQNFRKDLRDGRLFITVS